MADEKLVDMMINGLDQQGVLTKVKAQIKASVFKLIDQSQGKRSGVSNFFWENEKAKKIQNDNELLVLLEIVKEFLQFFDFEFSLSVLNSESNHLTYVKRDQLANKIGIKNSDLNSNQSILQQIYSKQISKTNTNINKTKNESQKDYNKQQNKQEQSKIEPIKPGVKTTAQVISKNQPIQKTSKQSVQQKNNNNNDFHFEEIEEDLDDVTEMETNKFKKNDIESMYKSSNVMLTSSEEQLASMSQGLNITVDSNEIDQYDHVEDIKWK